MVNVIPAPVSVESHDSEPSLLSASIPVTAAPGREPLAAWYVTEITTTTGVVIEADAAGDYPAIRLVVAADDSHLVSMLATSGIRTDSGDRDRDTERYALTIGAAGGTSGRNRCGRV